MRILQVCTNFLPGGIQRHVLDLTAYLRDQGHQVTLAGDAGDWGTADDPDRILLPLAKVAGTGGSALRRMSALIPVALTLRREIRARRIELVHSHETAPALAVRLATAGMRLPRLMTFHGAAPDREASVARIARTCADLTISPSKTSLDSLIAKGLPRDRTRHLGLGIAPMPVLDPVAVAALRRDLLGPTGRYLILSLSRLQPQKGIDVMVEAARRVVAREPGAVFAVAGKGPLLAQARGWAQDAGVAGNFRFLGPVSTVPLHLLAADLFLLTSRWEALPISIVEAFRAGLPAIATDCGGVSELIDSAVGALLPVGDAAGIADAILSMIADPVLARRKAAAALARSAEPRFDPATVHAGFAVTYAEMIAKAASGR